MYTNWSQTIYVTRHQNSSSLGITWDRQKNRWKIALLTRANALNSFVKERPVGKLELLLKTGYTLEQMYYEFARIVDQVKIQIPEVE